MNTLKAKLKKIKVNKKLGALTLLIVAIVIFAAFTFSGDSETMQESESSRRDIETFYTFTGNIESDNTQNVLSTNSLTVKKFYVDEGDYVSEGDLLLEFNNDSLEASIIQAKASVNLAQVNYEATTGTVKSEQTNQVENAYANAKMTLETAETNFNRLKDLYEAGAVSQSEFEQAKNTYDSAMLSFNTAENNRSLLGTNVSQNTRTAQAQLEQAQASLSNLEQQYKDTKIYAEVSGTVTDIYISENQQIVMGTKILDIIDYDNLKVEIKADEYGLSAFEIGKEVEVYVNAFDMDASGHVTKISEVASVENSVSYFPTTITLDANPELRVGMSVEVKVLNQSAENVIAVPLQAIETNRDNEAYIYVKDQKGKAETRMVSIGVNDGMYVEITDGLEEGEVIYIPEKTSDSFSMMSPGNY